jgi:hypothetical protein
LLGEFADIDRAPVAEAVREASPLPPQDPVEYGKRRASAGWFDIEHGRQDHDSYRDHSQDGDDHQQGRRLHDGGFDLADMLACAVVHVCLLLGSMQIEVDGLPLAREADP